jgi:hypothetical protein
LADTILQTLRTASAAPRDRPRRTGSPPRQHRPPDLAGLRTGVVGRQVLRAECDAGAGQQVGDPGSDRNDGSRKSRVPDAGRSVVSAATLEHQSSVWAWTEVHLQADADDHLLVTPVTISSANCTGSLNKRVIGLVLLESSG